MVQRTTVSAIGRRPGPSVITSSTTPVGGWKMGTRNSRLRRRATKRGLASFVSFLLLFAFALGQSSLSALADDAGTDPVAAEDLVSDGSRVGETLPVAEAEAAAEEEAPVAGGSGDAATVARQPRRMTDPRRRRGGRRPQGPGQHDSREQEHGARGSRGTAGGSRPRRWRRQPRLRRGRSVHLRPRHRPRVATRRSGTTTGTSSKTTASWSRSRAATSRATTSSRSSRRS